MIIIIISLGKWDTLKSNLYSWFGNGSRTERVNDSSLLVEPLIQEPMCIFLLRGFWSLLWNEVSSCRAAGRGKNSQRKTRHPKCALRRAGSQMEHLIGWLRSTPAVSWVGCGLTTFFQVSGRSLQATWLRRRASTCVTIRHIRGAKPTDSEAP